MLPGVHSAAAAAAAAWACSGADDSEIWKPAMLISSQDQSKSERKPVGVGVVAGESLLMK